MYFLDFTRLKYYRAIFGIDFGCLSHPEEPVLFAQNFDFAQTVLDKRFINPFNMAHS